MVRQKLSHCGAIGAPMQIQPSRQRYRDIGWNASPKRVPQRRLTAPVWVYIVSDHWWPAAPHSIAPTSTSWPIPVHVRSNSAACAAIVAVVPLMYDASGLPGLSGSRSGSPVR